MRSRLGALALTVGLLGASAAPAAAHPAQANAQVDVGAAVGDAGTAAALTRVLPGSIPRTSPLPAVAQLESSTRAFEGGVGFSTVSVDTGAELPFERAIAKAGPSGTALNARAAVPGGVVQTAPPSNPQPSRGTLKHQESPLDLLIRAERQTGQAHARWSTDHGPCVGRVVKATTSTGSIRLGTAIATLPDIPFSELDRRGRMPNGSLATLGQLLGDSKPLVEVPGTLTTTSVVDVSGKEVRATSKVQTDRLEVLGMTATVRHAPVLTAHGTGKPDKDRVVNDTPIVDFKRGNRTLFRLDRTRETRDVRIGVITRGRTTMPVVDGYARHPSGKEIRLSGADRRKVTELFALRLSVGGLTTQSTAVDKPFHGTQITASARLLDVQLLPTKTLTDALKGRYDLPSTLAHYTIGEQVVRAAAPPSGPRCGAPGAGEVTVAAPPEALAPSSADIIPTRVLLWGGAGLVLLGAYLLAVARPRKRRE